MRKILPLTLLSFFLWAQVATVLHAAEHGNDSHEHNGHTCEFYLFSAHNTAADIPAQAAPEAQSYTAEVALPADSLKNSLSSCLAFSARAPPYFS